MGEVILFIMYMKLAFNGKILDEIMEVGKGNE